MNSFLVTRISILVDTHFIQQKNSRFYAEQIGISVKSLNAVLKKYKYGIIADLVSQRTLTEAIRLLKETDKAMKNIAYDLNYCDPGHFNRVFKIAHVITPVEFRKCISYNKGRLSRPLLLLCQSNASFKTRLQRIKCSQF